MRRTLFRFQARQFSHRLFTGLLQLLHFALEAGVLRTGAFDLLLHMPELLLQLP
ncbi:hypothetical protein D3C71_1225970 [compost metagenome]